MYIIKKTSQFKKDIKKYQYNKKVLSKLEEALRFLILKKELPMNFYDHQLKGNLSPYRECHLLPDTLLVYKYREENLVLLAVRIGSHVDIFDM